MSKKDHAFKHILI